MLDLKVIVGSTRPGRAADRVIPWITFQANGHGAFAAEVLDLRDWQLPMFEETYATVGDPKDPAFSVPAVKDGTRNSPTLRQARQAGVLPPAAMRMIAAQAGAGK